MEIITALLALCAGNSPVTGEFPSQRPVTRSFDVFFDLRLSKRLSKQLWGWWFETPSCSLWRHCIVFRLLSGCSSKAEIVFVVDCSSSLSQENFHLQASFVREVVESLHVSEDHVRVGYVPYNTDVFEWFGLDQFTCRQEVALGIGKTWPLSHKRYFDRIRSKFGVL